MDEVGWSLLLTCIFTGSSLFFSLNNIALRTFSHVKLFENFKAGKREHLVDIFIDKLEEFTLTCSFFRVLSNTAVILCLLSLFDSHKYLLTLITGSLIFGVFTLLIPHSWAKYAGEKVIVATYPLLYLFRFIAWPLLVISRGHDHIVRRLAGVAESTPDQEHEERQEEIMNIVEQGRLEGVMDEEEMDMIESVLEFRETTVSEIMTPRTDVIALRIDEPLEGVLETISNAGHSRIPVYEDTVDNIIGLVYAKDMLTEIGNSEHPFSLRDKLREGYFVPETKRLKELLHEFQNQKVHIAIVLDEYGGTAGIVTIEDILEELVGEITDEYEEMPPADFKQLDENTAEVGARMHIDDVNEEFDIDLPEEEDFDTIGGFVFSHLGYVPKSGESFEYENLRFTVVSAEERKIKVIRIEKLPQTEKTGNGHT